MPFNYKTEINRYKRYYQSLGGFTANQRARNYSTVIFSFLAVSLFGWYAIRPTIQTILLLRREIDDDKVVNQQMEEKIAKLIEAQSTYQKIQNQLAVIKEAAPSNPQVLSVAASIQSLVSSSNASISALSVESSPLLGNEPVGTASAAPSAANASKVTLLKSQSFISIPVNATILGSYAQLMNIVNTLMQDRRILTIDSLRIGKPTEGGSLTGDNILQLVLKLNMYYVTE